MVGGDMPSAGHEVLATSQPDSLVTFYLRVESNEKITAPPSPTHAFLCARGGGAGREPRGRGCPAHRELWLPKYAYLENRGCLYVYIQLYVYTAVCIYNTAVYTIQLYIHIIQPVSRYSGIR